MQFMMRRKISSTKWYYNLSVIQISSNHNKFSYLQPRRVRKARKVKESHVVKQQNISVPPPLRSIDTVPVNPVNPSGILELQQKTHSVVVCICFRPKCNVFCAICGTVRKSSRIYQVCPRHPQRRDPNDLVYCPYRACNGDFNYLRELSNHQ